MDARWVAVMLLLIPAGSAQLGTDVVFNPQVVDATFDEWERTHPDFIERFEIGASLTGIPLYGVVITDEGAPSALSTGMKRPIYIDGGHHGNEYLGVQLAMYYAEDILDRLDEPAIMALLRDHEIHIVPIINPDGNLRDTRYNGRLVDLNRNYDFGWQACPPPSTCLGGDAPHSEPEIQANVAYVTALSPDIWISTHTGIETLFWPQGNANTPGDPFVPFAPDIGVFETMEVGFEAATNGRIDAYGGPAAAVGSAEDFGYGVLGMPSYVYEVHDDQFFPAYNEPMRDMLADQLAGMHFLVDNAWRMGAWVDAEQVDGGVEFTNHGWGPTNVTIIAPSGALVVMLDAGASERVAVGGDVRWEYPSMLIDTSRSREHAGSFAPIASESGDGLATPLPLLVVVAALVMALTRRR